MRSVTQRLGRTFRFAAILAPALMTSGCGGEGIELVPVNGKVLLNGQPLATGSITTMPPNGRATYAPIEADGSFELTSGRVPGAVVGTHKVAIVAVEGAGFLGAEAPTTAGKTLVPQRYNNYETSGLTIEVLDDDNSPVVELKSQ